MNFIKRWFSRQINKDITDTVPENELIEEKKVFSPKTKDDGQHDFLNRYLQYLQGSHAYLKF